MALDPTVADMPTAATTPKRKRGIETSITPVIFNFDLSRSAASEDGGNSPRSKVAHKFRGLALGGEDGGEGSQGGGGVVAPGQGDAGDPSYYPANKRIRADVVMSEASVDAAEDVAKDDDEENPGKVLPQPEVVADAPDSQQQNLSLPEGSLQRAYPSVNRLSDSKSRSTKRPGTPPPRHKKLSFAESAKDDSSPEEVEIVDPVRAALTWHEDEITIYDPEDEDDDGTGINGVGFKPTPALAHARVMKRRQQLAEYRKREENDARAKRSQRRRGAHRSTPSPDEGQSRRRVRFTDNDKPAIIATN